MLYEYLLAVPRSQYQLFIQMWIPYSFIIEDDTRVLLRSHLDTLFLFKSVKIIEYILKNLQ